MGELKLRNPASTLTVVELLVGLIFFFFSLSLSLFFVLLSITFASVKEMTMRLILLVFNIYNTKLKSFHSD